MSRTVVLGTWTEPDGDRVSLLERVDGSRFEVRVPKGAMQAWDDYATITRDDNYPWCHEVDSCSDEGEQESAA